MAQSAIADALRPSRWSPAKLEPEAAMAGLQNYPIAEADCARLLAVASAVSPEEHRQLRRLLPAAAAEARAIAGHWDFMAPSAVVDRLIEDPRAFPKAADERNRTRLRQAVVARLALGFFRPGDHLPESILRLHPEFFGRLSVFLHDRVQETYDDDFFAKDVRYALGLTIPCGALQFDLKTGIGPKLIARDLMATRSLRSTLGYVASSGWGRWYGNHLDRRAIKGFTPDGWTESFAGIAKAIELNPPVRGVVGVAWFYDPELARVSPHLSYIRETPLKHGAFLARLKTEPHDIENALARSLERKRLHARGAYSPACYLLAWPRRPLLAWAARLRSDASVAFGRCGESGRQAAA